MGYISGALQQGYDFAERRELNSYVAKARDTHPLLNSAVDKVDELCSTYNVSTKVDSLVENLDNRVDATLDVVNSKKEQARQLKADTTNLIANKRAEAGASYEKLQETIQTKKEETVSAVQKKKAAAVEQIKTTVAERKAELEARADDLKAKKTAAVEQLKSTVSKKSSIIVDMVGDASLAERKRGLNDVVRKSVDGKGETVGLVADFLIRNTDVVVDTTEGYARKALLLPTTLQERWETQGAPVVQKIKAMPKQALVMVMAVTASVVEPLHLDGMREKFETYVNVENLREQFAKAKALATMENVRAQFDNAKTELRSKYTTAQESVYTKYSELKVSFTEHYVQARENAKAQTEMYLKNVNVTTTKATFHVRMAEAKNYASDFYARAQEHELVLKVKESIARFQKTKAD